MRRECLRISFPKKKNYINGGCGTVGIAIWGCEWFRRDVSPKRIFADTGSILVISTSASAWVGMETHENPRIKCSEPYACGELRGGGLERTG